METHNAHIFFSGTLLGLDETGSPVQAHDQTARHLGIESSRVTRLFDTKDSFAADTRDRPSDDPNRRKL